MRKILIGLAVFALCLVLLYPFLPDQNTTVVQKRTSDAPRTEVEPEAPAVTSKSDQRPEATPQAETPPPLEPEPMETTAPPRPAPPLEDEKSEAPTAEVAEAPESIPQPTDDLLLTENTAPRPSLELPPLPETVDGDTLPPLPDPEPLGDEEASGADTPSEPPAGETAADTIVPEDALPEPEKVDDVEPPSMLEDFAELTPGPLPSEPLPAEPLTPEPLPELPSERQAAAPEEKEEAAAQPPASEPPPEAAPSSEEKPAVAEEEPETTTGLTTEAPTTKATVEEEMPATPESRTAETPEKETSAETPENGQPAVKIAKAPAKKDCKALEAINYAKTEEGFQADLLSGCPIGNYKHFFIAEPPKLVVDLNGKWTRRMKQLIPVEKSDIVKQIRLGDHPDYLRIVFDFKTGEPLAPTFTETPEGMRVTLRKKAG